MGRLDQYRRMRDFDRTPEPRAGRAATGGERLRFVVQKHDATRLHYDFRLEWQGALLSWAVTKGPSLDPSEKRLAVRTEDHPIGYGDFEGVIPEGNYGAGTVMLWDQGWWEPLSDPAQGLEQGKLHFRLHGARMRGGWALVRMRGGGRDKGRENWLLIKERDDEAAENDDALLRHHGTSVATGRAMAEIAGGGPALPPRRHAKALPRFRQVQLATLREAPPAGDGWRHEAKYDGYRCLAAVGKGGARLYTRNGKDWSDRFGALCKAVLALPCDAALIDGEVVADGDGDFSALQAALKSGGPLVLYAFDCLHLDGADLTGRPLTERRAALEGLLADLPPRGPIRLSPFIEGRGAEILSALCAAGAEGIVSKRADAPYRGRRTEDWIKAKCDRRAEFVICGWTASKKAGRPFSSLILGSWEGGRLIYRGKVGSGFDDGAFAALGAAFGRLARKTAPFGGDLPGEARRDAHWLSPDLVAEVKYSEFTASGRIRHGVYLGLREDKAAREVSAMREAEQDARGRTVAGVTITHPGRVVFPQTGLTKGGVADYYAAVADRFLVHAARRPVSLWRCPDGIGADCFFQKHAGKGFPEALGRVAIEEADGATADYIALSDARSVVAAVQMGTLEFHIWGAAADDLERPDRMVFDLDPDEGLGFDAVRTAAREVRDRLADLGLGSVPMVTGGKGVHVIVPLRRVAGWDTVSGFARTFAAILAGRAPARFTDTMAKKERTGRIFIDWLRNKRGATAVAPYSLRARPGAPVAVPVSWDELAGLAAASAFSPEKARARMGARCPLEEALAGRRGIGASVVAALEDWAGKG